MKIPVVSLADKITGIVNILVSSLILIIKGIRGHGKQRCDLFPTQVHRPFAFYPWTLATCCVIFPSAWGQCFPLGSAPRMACGPHDHTVFKSSWYRYNLYFLKKPPLIWSQSLAEETQMVTSLRKHYDVCVAVRGSITQKQRRGLGSSPFPGLLEALTSLIPS